MSTAYEQKMICNKNDGAPEQQDDNQPPSSSDIDAIDAVAEDIEKVTLLENSNDISEVSKEFCAACGKEGKSCDMNTCNKCKSVKYCNAACKKKHRSKHKKKCERIVAELYDEKLFADPPSREECPICFQLLPLDADQYSFFSCCGKTICDGCIYAMRESEGGVLALCAFCRKPPTTYISRSNEVNTKQLKNLMAAGNGSAFLVLAGYYVNGSYGLPQDQAKANELYLKAGELGCSTGYYNLADSYNQGERVEVDKTKAEHYYELAAMGGSVLARHNLGCAEWETGNLHRAMKHFIIAVRSGFEGSLEIVKHGFECELITKDEYANTLRLYHERQKEMRSDMRDKARGFYGSFPY